MPDKFVVVAVGIATTSSLHEQCFEHAMEALGLGDLCNPDSN